MIAGFYCTFKTTYMLTFSLRFISSCDSWSSPHPISNSQLHALLHFHLCPIYLVVFKGFYFFRNGISHLRGASRLDALKRLSPSGLGYPAVDLHLTDAPAGPSIPALSLRTAPLRYPTPPPDRTELSHDVSEPSSAYRFNGRTVPTLRPASAPGCDEPTSRCQTTPSM